MLRKDKVLLENLTKKYGKKKLLKEMTNNTNNMVMLEDFIKILKDL